MALQAEGDEVGSAVGLTAGKLPWGVSKTRGEGEATPDPSVSPLCWLSRYWQGNSTGDKKICILISLFHFGLSANACRGL